MRIVTLSEAKAVQVPVSAVFPLPGGAPRAGVAAASGASGADVGAAGTARETTGLASASTQFAVFVADGGRARQTAVELGARNGSAAWIRSGIATGQQVIAYPPATVRDGLRVAARKP